MQLKVVRERTGDYKLYVPRSNDLPIQWVLLSVANSSNERAVQLTSLCGTFQYVSGIHLLPGTEKIYDVRLNNKPLERP